jgi:hypothetical protein
MSADNFSPYKLVVEAGPNRGQEFPIAASGARAGRSNQNDILLTDPLLSRHHCRFEMRGGELWVVDLASANQTHVNGKVIEEAPLVSGDAVSIGDSVLRIVASAAAIADAPATVLPEAPVIDLGLDNGKSEGSAASRHALRPLLWTIAAGAVLLLGATYIIDGTRGRKPQPRPIPETHDLTLQIAYEKVEADATGIFRYEMTLSPDNILAIRIDDLLQNRHVRKESRVSDPELTRSLAQDIEAGKFFKLDPVYSGINTRPGALDSWDLTVTIGRNTHRVRVSNRLEPDLFRAIRERIETFGKNELGLWAIQFSRDKLVEFANEKYRVGRKAYDEREIQYDNLYKAIQCFKEAEFYLETIEPKPDFYAAISSDKRQALEELDRRYQEQRFRADRAINLQDWQLAGQELRILRELVPDRTDDRYKDATRKLLDVEARLKPRKR